MKSKLTGKVNDVLNYTLVSKWTSNTFIDEGYVTRSLMDGTSLSFGKMGILIGGREFDYSLADIYSGDSLFKQATPDNAGAATLSHDFMGQNLSLQFFNTMNTAGGNKQSKFGYAALFTGDLMGGMIKPILGYTVKPEGTSQEISSTFGSSTARTNIGEDKYMAAGVQFNMSGLTLEADYLNLTEEDAVTISSAKKDLETTSMVVLGRYTMGNWVPFVKYVSDKAERGGSDYLKRTATSLGFEYNHDEHAKCYFNYTMEDKKPTGGVNYKPTAILAGVKFNVDVF